MSRSNQKAAAASVTAVCLPGDATVSPSTHTNLLHGTCQRETPPGTNVVALRVVRPPTMSGELTMRRRMKGPFFAYWLKQEVDIMKSEFEETSSLIEAMLDDVKEEQQIRLQTIRETGPWNQDWETAVRQQKQLAQQALHRLKRHRKTGERIRQIEEKLPPTGGLIDLRYANPWILTWVIAGSAVLLNFL